ncbi:MAG: hypothetical protein WCF84_04425 [Anaerolineae bacterium]
MKTSFKQYKRSFKCNALPHASRSKAGRMARNAAKSGRIEKALERMTTQTQIGPDGIERYVSNPHRAAELLADALLYEEKRQARKRYAARKEQAEGASTHKRWGIYPLSQNGKPSDTPVQVLPTKIAAAGRAEELHQWGKRAFIVQPVKE